MTTYPGTTGDDSLNGSSGADALVGDTGNDTLVGGDGGDTIYGDLGVTMGTGVIVVPTTATNSDLASAIAVDGAYSLDSDPNIAASTVLPHVTVQATGIDAIQYYVVTLTAGTTITLDIDGATGGLDSIVNLLDASGDSLVQGDDSATVDPGSADVFDSHVTFTVATTGTYYITVGDWSDEDVLGAPIASAMTYTLNVTIEGEQTSSGGNDSLTGGKGDDLLFGGGGVDTAYYQGASTSYFFSGTTGHLTIEDSVAGRDGTDTVNDVEFVHFSDGTFAVADLLPPACFLAGTMIGTPAGETAVDELAIGDLVVTADGRALPVKFIGRQTVVTRFADPLTALPVCIRAGALGVNLPARDLFTSPGHAMLLDGLLVIAGALVNGASIHRMTHVPERFTYFHVELDEHAVILAEGAATETFCDNVPREIFDNGAQHKALYPDAQPIAQLDLPTVKSARQLPDHLRAILAARASATAPATKVAA